MPQFSFPVLNDSELLPCMADVEIPMDAGQLAKPSYEVVRPVFEQLVLQLTGITRCGRRPAVEHRCGGAGPRTRGGGAARARFTPGQWHRVMVRPTSAEHLGGATYTAPALCTRSSTRKHQQQSKHRKQPGAKTPTRPPPHTQPDGPPAGRCPPRLAAAAVVCLLLHRARRPANLPPVGLRREELVQPVFTAMDAFEHPELHDESIPCTNFFRQLCRLMAVCGVHDFSWRVRRGRARGEEG